MNLPLKNVLLVLEKRDGNQPKAYGYFGASDSGRIKANGLMETLRAAGVMCSPIRHTVEALVSRNWSSEEKQETIGPFLAGAEIIDQKNIDLFKQQGGVLFAPETMRNIDFEPIAVGNNSIALTRKIDPAIMDIFLEQGIKHFADRREIRVKDPISICAVVLSGAKFQGAKSFLEKNGYLMPRF